MVPVHLRGSAYFAIRGKKVHLEAMSTLPSEAKINGKIVSAGLLTLMTK